MPTIYSRKADSADADLESKLKRSIALVKENKMAGKKSGKKNGNKERASVSRERRLALALRAVLDSAAAEPFDETAHEADVNAAVEVLSDLGYGSLIGIPKRLKELNEALGKAVEAGDGKEISRLGLLIDRVKAGKDVDAPKAAAAEA